MENHLQPQPHLTDREFEILKLSAYGLVAKDTAFQLEIEQSTVETHIKNINKKFGCNKIPGSITRAFCSHILTIPEMVEMIQTFKKKQPPKQPNH